jgi:hypothetical protein
MNVLAQKIPGLARHKGQRTQIEARVKQMPVEIDKRIKRDFPETLDASTFEWGREHEPQLVSEINDAFCHAESLAADAKDKKIADEKAWAALERWRDLTVELFRRRAAAMRQEQC